MKQILEVVVEGDTNESYLDALIRLAFFMVEDNKKKLGSKVMFKMTLDNAKNNDD